MFIDPTGLGAAETYRLLVGSVVPRPVAWVTSGRAPKPTNLAPFSSFSWACQYPAMLGITVNRRRSGRKDTARNILADGEYVVNIASYDLLEQLHASSRWHPEEESEADALGLALENSVAIGVPRLGDVPISMECRLERAIEFSPEGGEFLVGRVVGWHVRDDVMVDGRIATELVDPVARLAGPRYCAVSDIVELAPVPGG